MFYRLEFMSLYALPLVKVAVNVASSLPMVNVVVAEEEFPMLDPSVQLHPAKL